MFTTCPGFSWRVPAIALAQEHVCVESYYEDAMVLFFARKEK